MIKYWKNYNGKRRNIKYLGHQYLSNILWYQEVFHKVDFTDRYYSSLLYELNLRYDGIRKSWKPLPIPNEIDRLRKMGLIADDNKIRFNGKVIGSISHIKKALND